MQKERVPIKIIIGQKQTRKELSNDRNSVTISITIKAGNEEKKYHKSVLASELEEYAQGIAIEIGQEVIKASIQELDNQIVAKVPKAWRNAGTEERWFIRSLGAIHYKRRVYVDEQKCQ